MSSKENPILSSHRDAATRVSTYLQDAMGVALKPIVALEVIARAFGVANWQTLKGLADQGRMPRTDQPRKAFTPAEHVTHVLSQAGQTPNPMRDRRPATAGRPDFADDDTTAEYLAPLPGTVDEVIELLLERSVTQPLPLSKEITGIVAHVKEELAEEFASVQVSVVGELMHRPVSIFVRSGLLSNQTLRVLIRSAGLAGGAIFSDLNSSPKEFATKLRNLKYEKGVDSSTDVLLLRTDTLENFATLAPLLRALSPEAKVILVTNPDRQSGAPATKAIMKALLASGKVPVVEASPQSSGFSGVLELKYLFGARDSWEDFTEKNQPRSQQVPMRMAKFEPKKPTQDPSGAYMHFARDFVSSGRTGKWSIVRNDETVDAAWAALEQAVNGGLFRGAYFLGREGPPGPNGRYILHVLTQDYADQEGVMAVREQLRELGYTEELEHQRYIDETQQVRDNPEIGIYRA